MKNRIAALSLTLALSVGLCAPAQAAETPFTDVPADHWAAEAIFTMAEAGVVTGVGGGQFAPDKTITYAEFITMIVRQFLPDQIGPESEPWYSRYMEVARSAVRSGDGSGLLYNTKLAADPSLAETPVSRNDMAEICWRTMELFPKYIHLPDTYTFVKEHPDASGHAQAVGVCYNLGILTGVDDKGYFNGEGVMTRAQAAVVMSRLMDYKKEVYSYLEAEPPANLPDNATQITDRSQLTNATGAMPCPGGFYLNPNIVSYGGSNIGITTKGYTTITLTFKASDKDTLLTASARLLGNSIWDPYEERGVEVVPAGETRTITFNCSNSESMGIYIADDYNGASFAEGWITNMYLLP